MFVTGTLRWPVGGMEEITQETTGVTHVLRGPAQTTSTVVAQPHPSVYYQCDMHPEVVSLQPGDCPKCGMQLDSARRGASSKSGFWNNRQPDFTQSYCERLLSM